MHTPSIPSPAPDSATRNLLTRAHLAAQAARFAPTPPAPFKRGLAAALLVASLTACGGGDPDTTEPDARVPAPCSSAACLTREAAQ